MFQREPLLCNTAQLLCGAAYIIILLFKQFVKTNFAKRFRTEKTLDFFLAVCYNIKCMTTPRIFFQKGM